MSISIRMCEPHLTYDELHETAHNQVIDKIAECLEGRMVGMKGGILEYTLRRFCCSQGNAFGVVVVFGGLLKQIRLRYCNE